MRKSVHLPYEQGHFDGLCGVYAVINALYLILQKQKTSRGVPYRLALSRRTAEKLYATLIAKGLSRLSVRNDAYIHGITSSSLSRLLVAAQKWLGVNYGIRLSIRRPFYRRKMSKSSLAVLIKRSGRRRGIIIIGGHYPWAHWSVVSGVSKRGLHLFDSSGYRLVTWRKWPKGSAPYFKLIDRRSVVELMVSEP